MIDPPGAIAQQGTFADFSYLDYPEEGAVTYMYQPKDGNSQGNCRYISKKTWVNNARINAEQRHWETAGFGLWESESKLKDYWDEESVRRHYYPAMAALACDVSGASKAYIFDHMLRRREQGRPQLSFGRQSDVAGAAGRIHNDYSEASGRSKLAMVIADNEQLAAIRRYSIVNIWRPLLGPVQDTPLALCDAQTVSTLDLVSCEVRRPDRKGEIYLMRHADSQRWYYYPEMTADEVLLFKQYDSKLNGVARMTPHTAFDLPHIPADAPLRESIELRCLLVY